MMTLSAPGQLDRSRQRGHDRVGRSFTNAFTMHSVTLHAMGGLPAERVVFGSDAAFDVGCRHELDTKATRDGPGDR